MEAHAAPSIQAGPLRRGRQIAQAIKSLRHGPSFNLPARDAHLELSKQMRVFSGDLINQGVQRLRVVVLHKVPCGNQRPIQLAIGFNRNTIHGSSRGGPIPGSGSEYSATPAANRFTLLPGDTPLAEQTQALQRAANDK